MDYLDIEIIRTKCHPDTVKYYNKKHDPIAPFETADLGLLESALAQPKWDYHKTIERKAAIQHYSMVKNHPFENGNKRIAVVALITFLYINDYEFNPDTTTDGELANMTLEIAKSDRLDRDSILASTEQWIRERITSAVRSAVA